MPKFQYKAKQGPTKIVDGVLDADTMDGAVKQLIQRGFIPIEVDYYVEELPAKRPEKIKRSLAFSNRVKLNDIAVFTRQMSDLVDAAVPILRALQIVVKQTQHIQLKSIVQDMYNYVNDGGAFSEALAQHKDIFSSLYINMVRTGEVGGQLDKILLRLADYVEKEVETVGKVRSSLAYPAFILGVGVVVVFILLTVVIPKLSVMFEDLDQALPMPTVVLTTVSYFFARFWWAILGAIGIGIFYLKIWIKSENGRIWFDNFILRLPLIGKFMKIVEIGRFSRTLGTLIESGVPITTALNAVCATIQNVVLHEEIKDVSDEVANGVSLKAALGRCRFFPEAATDMIAIGEETGNLEKGLYKIAATFERESDQTVKTLVSLLGPIVLVFIVSIVGFVVIAMLLPIFQMNMLIQ